MKVIASDERTAVISKVIELLDPGSFMEMGEHVSARFTEFYHPDSVKESDGVVTGYGTINGNLVFVYAQDNEVMGGTFGEQHGRKIVDLYEHAIKANAPVIGLLDCAGLRLQEATDALNAFGEIYMKQTLASGVIPQITAIFGTCGGGLALFPTMTDFTFMEGKSAKLFVNAPNALDGNNTSKCDSSAAKFQAEEAGIVDVVAEEADVLVMLRLENSERAIAELTIRDKGTVFRAEDTQADLIDAFDNAFDTVIRKIRKQKTKLSKRVIYQCFFKSS